jgi:Tfp pilus assembly protein PilN
VSQVNLLPAEILEGHRSRQIAALVGAAAALVLVLIFLFYVVQGQRLGDVNDDVATQQTANDNVQASIGALQSYETLQNSAIAQQQLLQQAYTGEVSFSRLLMDVSRVIPSDMDIDSLTIQLTAPGAAATTTTAPGTTAFVGTLSATGTAASVQSIATWLTRLEQVEGWVNPWTSNATLVEEGPSYTFDSSVDLTNGVLTGRGKGGSG